MHYTHKQRRHSSMDRVTGSLAAGSLACLMILGGCGPQNGEPVRSALTLPQSSASAAAHKARTGNAVPERTAAPVPVAVTGQVSHIETLTERPKGTGVGAVAGGVLGGVVGHQVGNGDGQKLATAAGAVGGALLGNKIERDRATRVVGYRVDVTLDNGGTRSFQRTQLGGLQVGSRVRIDGGNLQPA